MTKPRPRIIRPPPASSLSSLRTGVTHVRPRIRPRIIRSGMRASVTLREALNDPALLGGTLSGDSWKAWRVLLIASMGEPLTSDERELFQQLTGRPHEPGQRVE